MFKVHPLKSHFGITIPTKPYLSKYLQSLYGSPIVFSTKNYFGTSLLGYLTTRMYFQAETITHQKFDSFNTFMNVHLPMHWLYQYKFKTQIPKCNVIYLNKHFEERFEEDLSRFCSMHAKQGMQIKDALELFCRIHSIEIDEDITYDALKQKEYRSRKEIQKTLQKRGIVIN